ncbi:chromosome-associated kinesin KIF4A [Aplysia californica]|uniref:Chromosome-associated kinesin KIF4A n=1 Tax=Aplysia californica TaxID=6500 RepID=A0ABM0ZXT7_APLCA|nr:chromosome-associated kinesin KIF4A [Aplysia californica]
MPSESFGVKLVAKCRPLTSDEEDTGGNSVVSVSGDKVKVNCAGKESSFSFDGVFGPEKSNRHVYEQAVTPLLQKALDGNNVSILAFGATGGGKSHIMTGSEADPGVIPLMTQNLFRHIQERSNKEFMVTVSHVEILDENMTDLLNPHTRSMKIRQHPHKGIFIDGLSELVVHTGDDIALLYDQGTRARKLGSSDIKTHAARANAIFIVCVEQKERQSSKVGLRSTILLADLAGCEAQSSADPNINAGARGVLNIISALGDGKRKGGHIPYRDSKVSRVLQDSLGGNSATLIIAALSPLDKSYQDTLTCLQYCSFAKNIKNTVQLNLDDTQDVISEMRQDIARLRDKIAAAAQPERDDVAKMEALIQDLEIAKKQTWAEKEKQSAKFEDERKINLANKGILEWVMDSMKKGNREVQEQMMLLQKEKDQLTDKYKEKRKVVESMKEELQKKISEYAKFTESGKKSESETKSRVTAIHELKERLKKETEGLKQLKEQLFAVQQKQQQRREDARAHTNAVKGSAELRQKVEKEERLQMELEHKAMVEEELEKSRLELDSEKTEIQLQAAEGRKYSTKEGADLQIQVAEMKADKSVVTLKLQTLEKEKQHLASELEEVYTFHKEELEVQQLQHYQTFRSYREIFEEQKAAIDQRYRQLLEDSIQDAVYLSSRNNDLTEENQHLKHQIAQLKDVITKLGGKLPETMSS